LRISLTLWVGSSTPFFFHGTSPSFVNRPERKTPPYTNFSCRYRDLYDLGSTVFSYPLLRYTLFLKCNFSDSSSSLFGPPFCFIINCPCYPGEALNSVVPFWKTFRVWGGQVGPTAIFTNKMGFLLRSCLLPRS